MLQQVTRYIHAAGRCMGQRVCDTAAVADDIQAFMAGLQVLVDLDFHIVELDFHAVQQRVIVCRAGSDPVERIDHFNDAVQDALWQHEAQIAGRSRERRRHEAFLHTLDRAAAAADQVTEALHDDPASQHVGEPRYTFTVTESAAYVAHFQLQSFNISVSANPTNGGTVTGGGTYNYGQNCTVVATANTGYDFVNWTENGTQVSTNASYSFTVNASRDLVANFETQTVDIKVNVNPADAGEVTGEGSYSYGDEVTLIVTPYENYAFENWTDENGVIVCEEPTYTFTATTSCTLTVNLINTEGVGEQSGNTVLYPNPASDKLIIEAQESIDKLEIYNLMGALVYSQNDCTNKAEVAVGDLPGGVYFLRLTTSSGTQVQRFVKE